VVGKLRAERSTMIRLWRIHSLIKNYRYPNVRSLSEDLGVHSRTIERDLEQLRDRMSAPVEYDRDRKGYYYVEEFSLPPFQFSEGEMVALFLGQKLLAQFEGTSYKEDLGSLLDKLQCLLSADSRFPGAFLEEVVSFNVAPLRGEDWRVAGNFSVLQKAIGARRKVLMVYQSINAGEVAERTVCPYHLRYYNGAWYLVAFCLLRSEVRIFALDRIEALQAVEETFVFPEDFKIEEYLDGVLGIVRGRKYTVEVRFDRFQARWIREKALRPGEAIREEDGGGVIFECEVSGLTEIKQWVLSFGSHAEVLGPEELREEIREEVKQLGKVY
jgi:predicted DNA-binding transcriptional regulator YafY